MLEFLVFIIVAALIVHIFVCLAYFVSSIWEKEKRAGIFAGLQLLIPLGLLGLVFYLSGSGFFDTIGGMVLLGAGVILVVLAPLLLMIKTHPNNKALEGTKGFIVGSVQRFDERATVFSRNRSLRPGSQQFEQFYAQHPEYAEYDAARRKLGGRWENRVRLTSLMRNRIWRHPLPRQALQCICLFRKSSPRRRFQHLKVSAFHLARKRQPRELRALHVTLAPAWWE